MRTYKAFKVTGLLPLLFISLASLSQAQTVLFNTTYITPAEAPSSVWEDADGKFWNYVPTWGPWSVETPLQAKTSENTASGIGFSIMQRFGYFFSGGPTESALDYPDLVAKNGLWLSSVNPVGGVYYTTAQIRLTGLDPSLTYDFTFYGTSQSGATNNQGGLVIAFDDDTSTTLVVSSATREGVVSITGISSNAAGELYLDFSLADDYSWGYLNAFSVTAAIPEPSVSVSGLLILTTAIFLFRHVRNRRKN